MSHMDGNKYILDFVWSESWRLRVRAMGNGYWRHCGISILQGGIAFAIIVLALVVFFAVVRQDLRWIVGCLAEIMAFGSGVLIRLIIEILIPRKIRFAPPRLETMQEGWVRRIWNLGSLIEINICDMNEQMARVEFWYKNADTKRVIVVGASHKDAEGLREMVRQSPMQMGLSVR